jgi:5'(3')-deoxyribonucleotidase
MALVPLANRRFLVDVDDVLADLRPKVLNIVNEVSGGEFTPDDFTGWDYFSVLDEYQKHRAFQLMGAPGFCRSLQVLPGAKEAIRELQDLVKVLAVTWPFHVEWFNERYDWLEQEVGIQKKDVILASSKYAVAGKWFLDDNLDNVRIWSEGNPCMEPMLWNTRATRDLGYDRLRVHSWDEVVQRVKSGL